MATSDPCFLPDPEDHQGKPPHRVPSFVCVADYANFGAESQATPPTPPAKALDIADRAAPPVAPAPASAADHDGALAELIMKHRMEQAILQRDQEYEVAQLIMRYKHQVQLRRLREMHGLHYNGDARDALAPEHVPSSQVQPDGAHEAEGTISDATAGAFLGGVDAMSVDDDSSSAPTQKEFVKTRVVYGKKRGRGNYRCGKCGMAKTGHICPYKKPTARDLARKKPPMVWVRSVSTQADVDMTGASGRTLADISAMSCAEPVTDMYGLPMLEEHSHQMQGLAPPRAPPAAAMHGPANGFEEYLGGITW